jgi:hypothetical protein
MAKETVKKEAAKKEAPVVAPEAEATEKKEPKDVHELLWVQGKGWGVKRQGSEKVIKYFKTKLEATEYVVKVSGNMGTRVVIHLKNGKFQKFDNAMRALSYAKDAKEEE